MLGAVIAAQFYFIELLAPMRPKTGTDVIGNLVFRRQMIEAIDDECNGASTGRELSGSSLDTLPPSGVREPDLSDDPR